MVVAKLVERLFSPAEIRGSNKVIEELFYYQLY